MAKGEEKHKRNTASAAGRTSPVDGEGLEEDHGKTWSEEDTNKGKLREATLS